MRYSLFVMVLFCSLMSYSKNKIIFNVPNPTIGKLPDLYILTDYKKGIYSKRFIENEVVSFASTEEYIVYSTKEGKLYMIKDFESYSKILITENLNGFRIHQNTLFYETVARNTKTLWYINDFKNLKANEVMQNYVSFDLDQ